MAVGVYEPPEIRELDNLEVILRGLYLLGGPGTF